MARRGTGRAGGFEKAGARGRKPDRSIGCLTDAGNRPSSGTQVFVGHKQFSLPRQGRGSIVKHSPVRRALRSLLFCHKPVFGGGEFLYGKRALSLGPARDRNETTLATDRNGFLDGFCRSTGWLTRKPPGFYGQEIWDFIRSLRGFAMGHTDP